MEKDNELHKPKNKFRELREAIDPAKQQLWNQEQIYLRNQLVEKDDFDWNIDTLKYVAGVDISFSKNHENIACSALVILERVSLKVVYEDFEYVRLDEPYVPGFLAFREIPSLIPLFDKLREKKPELWPQVILVDGNGIIHQNGFGLACHLGVLLNTPTVGCGKTFFYVDGLSKQRVEEDCEDYLRQDGDYVKLVGKSKREWAAAVKVSKGSDQPVFVSIGHKISLLTAIDAVLSVSVTKIPEPIRAADLRSRQKMRYFDKNFYKLENDIKHYPMIYKKQK